MLNNGKTFVSVSLTQMGRKYTQLISCIMDVILTEFQRVFYFNK